MNGWYVLWVILFFVVIGLIAEGGPPEKEPTPGFRDERGVWHYTGEVENEPFNSYETDNPRMK